ncbi:hypothetical protein V5799_006118 [Amblyomma americanum]|uniref:PWWP domain-containing protein n=1 Tax=Amblyomma americanum TaxID=6943 RepID=A0AAQ4DXB3_AMBAM
MPDAVHDVMEQATSVSGADEPAMTTDSVLGTDTETGRRTSCRVRTPSVLIGAPGGDRAVPMSEPTAQSAPRKRKLTFEQIPPNLQAVVSRNLELPTLTKSLPSRMERMKFGNRSEVAVRRKAPRKSNVKTCVTHFRQQGLSRSASDNTHSLYACQKCSFRTSRMDNLVRHKKADCAFIKDFFSWDANTFTEATEMSKKRSLSPDVLVESESTEEASKTPVAKCKGSARKSEASTRTSEKKKSVERDEKSKQALGVCEESSEDEAPTSKRLPPIPLESVYLSSEDEAPTSTRSPPIPLQKLEFGVDDVVWVEWKKHLHWPGIVTKIMPRKKKARIRLVDALTNESCVLASLNKIVNFNNAERNRLYLSRARVGQTSGALVKAVQRVEEYLRKRCLGSNVGPRQFFWDEVPFTEGPPSVNSDDFYLDALCSDSGLASEGAGDAVDEVAARIKEKRKQCNERLLQCIINGNVNSHLLGVLNGTVDSERHHLFYSSLSRERTQLKRLSWFGPIDDVQQQEEIYEFCFELLKANSDLDASFDIASYVIEVWCPEAVMKALSLTLGIDMEKAEEVLLRATVLSKAEHEARRHEHLTPAGTDATEEHDARVSNELRDIGIADIMATFDS